MLERKLWVKYELWNRFMMSRDTSNVLLYTSLSAPFDEAQPLRAAPAIRPSLALSPAPSVMSFSPKLLSRAAKLPRRTANVSRGLATVVNNPVRRYGGLKDQDRIFSNAYMRHDHGIKGAQVSKILGNRYRFFSPRATT